MKSLLTFEGRYDRPTFWLCFIAFGLPSTLLQNELTQQFTDWAMDPASNPSAVTGMLTTLAIMLPASWFFMVATVKRLHDRNKSWAWALIGSIPILGLIYLLIECGTMPAVSKGNKYGKFSGKIDFSFRS